MRDVTHAESKTRVSRLTVTSQPQLHVGSVLDIGVSHAGATRWFTTRVQVAALVSGTLTTDWPSQPGSWLAQQNGQTLHVAYTTRGSVFFADATLILMRAEAPSALVLQIQGDWREIERRLSRRYLTGVPATIETQTDRTHIAGTLVDLSVGGVRVSTASQLGKRDRLNLCFILPGAVEPMLSQVSVVRVEQSSAATDLWTYGCRFEGLLDVDQERIARVVELLEQARVGDASQTERRRWLLQRVPVLGWFSSRAISHSHAASSTRLV
jgi:hypothetical protein